MLLIDSRYWCGGITGKRYPTKHPGLVAGTGEVSRYKLSRSQKLITVQDLNRVQMRVSGCKNHYVSVLSAGAKAKSVTTCHDLSGQVTHNVRVSLRYLLLFGSNPD